MRIPRELSLGAPDREHEISAPGGAYRPVLCHPVMLESISTVRLTSGAPSCGAPGKSFAAGQAFRVEGLSSFQERHLSSKSSMRLSSVPLFHGVLPEGNSSMPVNFSALSHDHVSRGLSASIGISSLQTVAYTERSGMGFLTGCGKRPSGSGSSSSAGSSCWRSCSSRSRRSSSSLLLFSASSLLACS